MANGDLIVWVDGLPITQSAGGDLSEWADGLPLVAEIEEIVPSVASAAGSSTASAIGSSTAKSVVSAAGSSTAAAAGAAALIKLGSVAVSQADNRIYLIGLDEDDDQALLIYDQFGVFVSATKFADQDAAFEEARGLYVPEADKVWVSIQGGTDDPGQVWEYDSDGVFVEVIADDLNAGHTITSPRQLTHSGDVLFFLGITAGDVHNNGVYRHLISSNAPLPVLIAPTGGLSWDLKRNVSGNRLLQSLSENGARLLQFDGTIEKDYTAAISAGGATLLQGFGIAPHQDGETFWVADHVAKVIYRLTLADNIGEPAGTIVDSFSIDGSASEGSDYILATVLSMEPPTPPGPEPGLIIVINGVHHAITSLDIQSAQDGIHTATLDFRTTNPAAMALDDDIKAYEDGELIFGGTIKAFEVSAYGDSVVEKRIRIEADDYNEIATRDKIFGTFTIPVGTFLRDAVDLVLPYVPGVVKDPAWTDDVDLDLEEDLVFEDARPDEVLLALAKLPAVNRLHRITYEITIDYWVPGTRLAPWALTDGIITPAGTNTQLDRSIGDIITRRARENYFNAYLVRYTALATPAYSFFQATGSNGNANDGDTVSVAGKTATFRNTPAGPDDVQIGATAADSRSNLATWIDGLDEVAAGVQDANAIRVTAEEAGEAGNSIQTATSMTDNMRWGVEGFSGESSHLGNGTDEGLFGRALYEDAAEIALYGRHADYLDHPEIRGNDVGAYNMALAAGQRQVEINKTIPIGVQLNTFRKGPIFPGQTVTIQATTNGVTTPTEFLVETVNVRMMNEGDLTVREIGGVTIFKGIGWRDLITQWTKGTETARVAH